jgi:Cu-Zn family superoxide dismutase
MRSSLSPSRQSRTSRFATLLTMAAIAAAAATVAEAQPTAANVVLRDAQGRLAGTATFTQAGNGVQLAIDAQGLPPGPHGFHVHKNGECAPGPDAATGNIVAFGAAGGHFDPMQSMKHGAPDTPPEHAHAGDMPNLVAGADGRAQVSFNTPKLTVAPGKLSVLGRTLVIHEKVDDHVSNPAGNSGGRVLCGLIEPGTTASPSPATARRVLPGANTFPEGIAVHEASGTAYVGSSSEGTLFKLEPGKEKAEVLSLGGSPGRQAAFGIQLDKWDRLWVAGGPNGTVALVDRRDGRTLRVLKTPTTPAAFVNDLAISTDGNVYVTDSSRPVIFRTKNVENDALIAKDLEPWLDLSRTPVKYDTGINLNGIVAKLDGRLLLAIQSNTGQLWRIDIRGKSVSEVKLDAPLKNGDGLVLRENSVYVIRNAEGEIARVDLDSGWRNGKVARRLSDPRLKYPTTAAWGGDGLWVVNGQLDKRKDPPPLLPFDVLRITPPQ